MKDLAERLSAGCGYGIDVTINNGFCTGEIGGSLSYSEGKVNLVEKLLKTHNITWNDVIVVFGIVSGISSVCYDSHSCLCG
ncbi:MAG: hypothetical protein NUV86_11475 [Candidatus Scalindua sp.]|nr:hypothetical protein [Candidatus Scalindua sp.]MCR4344835.1 hypothetical protein [Candidatus Scalindua sp.]